MYKCVTIKYSYWNIPDFQTYCRKTLLKGGVSIFVYRNLKYSIINIDQYKIDKDFEACAIQLDSTFDKLCVLAFYTSPKDDFTKFLKRW